MRWLRRTILAACPGFASQVVSDYIDLSQATAPAVSDDIRTRILLFDWWIKNGDRSDENSNLLWVAHEKAVHVIDHNLAFDKNLSAEDFWQSHIFRSSRPSLSSLRQTTEKVMADIIGEIPEIWTELPDKWIESVDLGAGDIVAFLNRYTDATFWEPG